MAAREPSDTSSSRSGSYAAAGYVHLAPLSADGKTDKVMSTQDRNDDGGDDDLTRSRGGVAPLWDRSYGSVVSTSESVSPYPKTARFEHVKTDQGTHQYSDTAPVVINIYSLIMVVRRSFYIDGTARHSGTM